MIHNIETRLSKGQISRGQALQGLICFSTSSTRNLTDFSIQISPEASLHTVVPTSSGICSHADRIAFRDSKVLTDLIPATGPTSLTYKDMAKIQWKLSTSITDLSIGHASASEHCVAFSVVPSMEDTKSSPITRLHKKMTYTANTTIVPATNFFVQLAYPAHYNIVDHRLTLTKSLKISNGSASFVKKTERPLTISKVISRKAPDQSNLMVLEVLIPAGLESTVNVVGLVRSYSISVYVAPKNKTALNLSFDVSCDYQKPEKCTAASSARTSSTQIKISNHSNPINASLCSNPSISLNPRTAPMPPTRQAVPSNIQVHDANVRDANLTAESLHSLSMSQLASKALSSNNTSVVTRSSSTSSQGSMSDYASSSSASPRSVASSISDTSSRDQRSMHSSSVPATPESRSSQDKSVGATSRHKRQTSSFSIMSKRTSSLMSFSRLGRRLKSTDSFEFSCCGPSEIPQPSPSSSPSTQHDPFSFPEVPVKDARRERSERSSRPSEQTFDYSDDVSETSGSCYSSMPSTPSTEADSFDLISSSPTRTSGLARRLSFTRAFQKDQTQLKRGSATHYPMPDKRFSISTCYLDGFNFEGLASLDDEPFGDDQDSVYSLNLAAGQAL